MKAVDFINRDVTRVVRDLNANFKIERIQSDLLDLKESTREEFTTKYVDFLAATREKLTGYCVIDARFVQVPSGDLEEEVETDGYWSSKGRFVFDAIKVDSKEEEPNVIIAATAERGATRSQSTEAADAANT